MKEVSNFANVRKRFGTGIHRMLGRVLPQIREMVDISEQNLRETRKLADLVLQFQTEKLQAEHPNPINRFGKKCFSQSDEDGITLEILRRIGRLDKGIYCEFGVGNGTENNTLVLAALGWRGF